MDFFNLSAAEEPRHTAPELPNIPEYPMEERMRQEREVTGLYLSGHPMDGLRAVAKRHGAVFLSTIKEDFSETEGGTDFIDGQSVVIAGIISSCKTKTTRNQNLMAYAVLEDETSSIEVLCFSRTLERYRSILEEGSIVLMRGTISVRDDKPPQIKCEEVYPLRREQECAAVQSHPGAQVLEGKILWIRLEREDHPALPHINRLIAMFPGTTPARIVFSDSGKRLGTTCLLAKSLVDELVEGLGSENVVIR